MSTKVLVWKQGEAQSLLGKKILSFDHKINPGPSDHRIGISGFNVHPDDQGHFISNKYSSDELDAINTYGISRYILDLYEKTLGKPIKWSWESANKIEPISIYIRDNGINARYNKETKCIELNYYGPYENWTFYCRSVDIIAHETGHAILDSLKPQWESSNIETRGMAEAFCDLSAMFFIISQLDLCEEVIKETSGDLRKKNILSEFGIGYGLDNNGLSPIRTALNTRIYQSDFPITYDFAEVLNGTLYDLLIAMVTKRDPEHGQLAAALNEVGRMWQNGIIQAFVSCNNENSNLSEFQYYLIQYLPAEIELINKTFQTRKIPQKES